ncbi:hypothetical protein PC119_g27003 [Phytophthora cactorum]|uniref:Uncharacterized protein n=1 Tax=Phytophthora cactorum TaxID=29920 RepID=A0A8T1AEJ7_9STRA|nr:hypothetical protein PC117_g27135 [Phytophthora cactorum]KAG2958461.1 hypothetical protein PC119_g27003 [Phytophthora cactorum]
MDALNVPKEDARFRTYATSQVSRWEQVQSGRVCPPGVEYTWPETWPDSEPWVVVVLVTSPYLSARAEADDPNQMWVREYVLGPEGSSHRSRSHGFGSPSGAARGQRMCHHSAGAAVQSRFPV